MCRGTDDSDHDHDDSPNDGDTTDHDDNADNALLVEELSDTWKGRAKACLFLYDFFLDGAGFSGFAGAASSVGSALWASSSAA